MLSRVYSFACFVDLTDLTQQTCNLRPEVPTEICDEEENLMVNEFHNDLRKHDNTTSVDLLIYLVSVTCDSNCCQTATTKAFVSLSLAPCDVEAEIWRNLQFGFWLLYQYCEYRKSVLESCWSMICCLDLTLNTPVSMYPCDTMTCSILWLCGLHTSGIGVTNWQTEGGEPMKIPRTYHFMIFHVCFTWNELAWSCPTCPVKNWWLAHLLSWNAEAMRLYHLILAVEVDAKPTNNDVFHGLARHMHFHVILRTLHVSVSNNWNLKLDTNLSPHCLGTFTSCTELRGPLEQQSTH